MNIDIHWFIEFEIISTDAIQSGAVKKSHSYPRWWDASTTIQTLLFTQILVSGVTFLLVSFLLGIQGPYFLLLSCFCTSTDPYL